MDQGLAVEAEIARLRAFQRKAVDIAEVAVGPSRISRPWARAARMHA